MFNYYRALKRRHENHTPAQSSLIWMSLKMGLSVKRKSSPLHIKTLTNVQVKLPNGNRNSVPCPFCKCPFSVIFKGPRTALERIAAREEELRVLAATQRARQVALFILCRSWFHDFMGWLRPKCKNGLLEWYCEHLNEFTRVRLWARTEFNFWISFKPLNMQP